MQRNIKLNNTREHAFKILTDEYFDFMLYKGETYGAGEGMATDCLAAHIDLDDDRCIAADGLASNMSWENAVGTDETLEDIGLTGVDNGFIHYDKYSITNKQFLDYFFGSELRLDSGDTRFKLYKVDGNQDIYDCDAEIVSGETGRYLALKGGFYQGFYKLYGFDYQTLPDYIDDAWNIEMVIRPRPDYETTENIMNKKYPDNSGMFLYMGTRAENKFTEFYNKIYEPKFEDPYIEEGVIDWGECPGCQDIDLSGVTIETSDGHEKNEWGYFELETDNKHIFFNRTCTGFTVHNWDHENEPLITLTGLTKQEYPDNPFLLFNRTCTGWTTHNVDEKLEESYSGYTMDPEKDVIKNAFGLRLTENGAIEYKYTTRVCPGMEYYDVSGNTNVKLTYSGESAATMAMKQITASGIVKDNVWNVINVKFEIINHSGYDACGRPNGLGSRKMRIKIYVNGILYFISSELPEFLFRELDDVATKQEGVPYNISIGGGTLGLAERVWLDFKNPPSEHYFLEKNYAGSFIGDIKSFKMYVCALNISEIKNNYRYENNK